MADQTEILKFRILMCFVTMSEEGCNVTNLAKVIAVEKYTVSRILTALEREGMIDRSSRRRPKLTSKGRTEALKYKNRMEIAMNHLKYEGVLESAARKDAFYLARYCSEETFQAIQNGEERHRMKYIFKDQRNFTGEQLCQQLHEGNYRLPFVIYKEDARNQPPVSMANEGFEHPCELMVRKKRGVIRLKASSVSHGSAADGRKMHGKIENLKYECGGAFWDAEHIGDFLQFPADSMHFMNLGSYPDSLYHGTVKLKMRSSAGTAHMPESVAVFTVIF